MWTVYYEWIDIRGGTSKGEMSFEYEEDADEFLSLLNDKVSAYVALDGYKGDLDGRSYELQVVDTLERPCDYLWSVTYYVGRQGTSIMCGKLATLEAAKAAANAHHCATILSAFGIGRL